MTLSDGNKLVNFGSLSLIGLKIVTFEEISRLRAYVIIFWPNIRT